MSCVISNVSFLPSLLSILISEKRFLSLVDFCGHHALGPLWGRSFRVCRRSRPVPSLFFLPSLQRLCQGPWLATTFLSGIICHVWRRTFLWAPSTWATSWGTEEGWATWQAAWFPGWVSGFLNCAGLCVTLLPANKQHVTRALTDDPLFIECFREVISPGPCRHQVKTTSHVATWLLLISPPFAKYSLLWATSWPFLLLSPLPHQLSYVRGDACGRGDLDPTLVRKESLLFLVMGSAHSG